MLRCVSSTAQICYNPIRTVITSAKYKIRTLSSLKNRVYVAPRLRAEPQRAPGLKEPLLHPSRNPVHLLTWRTAMQQLQNVAETGGLNVEKTKSYQPNIVIPEQLARPTLSKIPIAKVVPLMNPKLPDCLKPHLTERRGASPPLIRRSGGMSNYQTGKSASRCLRLRRIVVGVTRMLARKVRHFYPTL